MKKKYKAMIKEYNDEHMEYYKALWEINTGIERFRIGNKVPGKKPEFKHNKSTGAQVRDGKGGVDWMRYREEILKPLFLLFLKKFRD